MVPLRQKQDDKRQVGTDIPNGESVEINFSPKNSDNGSTHNFSQFLLIIVGTIRRRRRRPNYFLSVYVFLNFIREQSRGKRMKTKFKYWKNIKFCVFK